MQNLYFLNFLHQINNKLVNLENFNSLIVFENSIMCERLEGLYNSIQSLLGSLSLTEKLKNEFLAVLLSVKKMSTNYESLQNSIKKIVYEKDKAVYNYESILKSQATYEEVKGKIINSYKTSISILKQDLENQKLENSRLVAENSKFETKLNNVSAELSTYQKKYSKSIKNNAFSLYSEKLCGNCNKTYFEDDNFNWSCSIHHGKYNGQMY